MIGRIVEIAEDQRFLSLSRGFLVVKESTGDRNELGRVPINDVAALIGNSFGLSYTNNLLVALAERGIPFVLCAANHSPVGMLWPVDGHHQQAKRFDAQVAAAKPVRKRLWAEIVRCKLKHQASVLAAAGMSPMGLERLAAKVRSGDPENIEAQGARRYWNLLFGNSFRRDRNAGGLNGLLNYGYTVYRASMARSIIAAGLHPSMGIFHSNEGNAMRLVDDLVEPFRPVVDHLVWQMSISGETEVMPATKRILVRSLYEDLQSDTGVTPTMVSMQRLAVSLAQVYLKDRDKLDLPLPGLPLYMATTIPDG